MTDPGTPRDWTRARLWQIQPVRDAVVVAAIVGVLWLGYRLSAVTVPMMLALALAYLVEPLVRRLEKLPRMSRGLAAGAILAAATVVVGVPAVVGLGYAGVQAASAGQRLAVRVDAVVRSVEAPADASRRDAIPEGAWRRIRDYLVEQRARAAAQADAGAAPAPGVATSPPPSPEYAVVMRAVEWARENAARWSGKALELGTGVVSTAAGLAGSFGLLAFGAFLTAFFFFYFCAGYPKIESFLAGLIPARRRPSGLELWGRMDRVIAGFVRGRLTICALLVVWYSAGYSIIGTPAALILGPVVGILTLAPFLSSLGAPVAMALMWLEPADGARGAWWWIIAAPLALFVFAQFLDDYVLTPRIQGKATDMDSPSILFASIAGGILAGVYGLLLAIPAAACLKIIVRDVLWPRYKAWAECPDPAA